MSRVVIIGGLGESLINFRGDLLRAVVGAGHEVIAMAGEAEPAIVEALADRNVVFRPFPLQRSGLNPISDLKTYFFLRRALRDLDPDVVLSYTIKPVVWGGMALRSVLKPEFYALVTGRGFSLQDGSRARRGLAKLVSCLYRHSLSRASRVIFQNPDDRDDFVSQDIVEEYKCAVVRGSGIDLDRFSLAPMPEGEPVFLAIGRLLGDKGFREYAAAAQQIKRSHPNVVCRLLGPEDPSPDGIPLAEVRKWQSAGAIDYVGETQDVRPYIAAAHVFVHPSYHEGMPRTVLEAMAMGRPILTTAVSGCRETVNAGENGFLVPHKDAEALAERMKWFIEHRTEWVRMATRSRELAELRFDVHQVNADLMTIMGLAANSLET